MTATPEPALPLVSAQNKPRPLASITAAATRLTSQSIKDRPGSSANKQGTGWQQDAQDMFMLVGEQRFLATTLAHRMSQARLYAGVLNDDPTQPPTPLPDTDPASRALAAFGDTPQGRAQLVERMGINLNVLGDGWFVGIPKRLLSKPDDTELAVPRIGQGISPMDGVPEDEGSIDVDDLVWRMMSVAEVDFPEGKVRLRLDMGRTIECEADHVWLIRVWRPDPFRFWQADSSTRSNLPVLRNIVGLTMMNSSQVDSRLSGAGLFIIPQSAADAMVNSAGNPAEGTASDLFVEAFMTAANTAKSDPSSAAAQTPICLVVPDDMAEKFKHLTFGTPLDGETSELLDKYLRRFALGSDAPPELLLGTSDSNHWSAWLVREDVITTHVEPPLALVCDGITTQYLWEVLEQQGMDEAEYQKRVIWYDVAHLIVRPNRPADAARAYQDGVIDAEAYRESLGFSDEDAPTKQDPAIALVLQMVAQAPSLAQMPGLPALLEQVQTMLGGQSPEPTDEQTDEIPDDTEGGIPATDGQEPRAITAAATSVTRVEPDREEWSPPPMNLTVNIPERSMAVHLPDGMVNMTVQPTPVNIDNYVDVSPTPINVESAAVTVEAPNVNVTPHISVEPTPIHVASPNVNVESPTVNVEAPSVTVEAAAPADVTVNVPESPVTVNVPEAPAPEVTVNVEPTPVEVNVEAPKSKSRKIVRDADGLITGVKED